MIEPKWAVWLSAALRDLPFHILSTIEIAEGPEILATAIPPTPGGVEIAQIVSLFNGIIIILKTLDW
jgi:hypothetical protein